MIGNTGGGSLVYARKGRTVKEDFREVMFKLSVWDHMKAGKCIPDRENSMYKAVEDMKGL